jgi:hypothetical protein
MFCILDDVLPEPIFKRVSGLVCENQFFNFGAVETSLPTDTVKSFATEPGSEWEKQFFTLPLVMAVSKINLEIQKSLRIRFGLLHRDIEQIVNTPHVDNPFEQHFVGLYYLNDTDGTTKIWKQTHTEWGNKARHLSLKDVDLLEEVPPKANRMVIFDGKHFHSSTLPTKTQLRYTINYNFTFK